MHVHARVSSSSPPAIHYTERSDRQTIYVVEETPRGRQNAGAKNLEKKYNLIMSLHKLKGAEKKLTVSLSQRMNQKREETKEQEICFLSSCSGWGRDLCDVALRGY